MQAPADDDRHHRPDDHLSRPPDEEFPDPWPLGRLVLRTPRLELRPDDDDGLRELIAESHRGVHDPATMPFLDPWTDAPPEELGVRSLRFYWRARADLRPDDWLVNFVVRLDGEVVGTQGLRAREFPVLRQVSSGSWVGLRFQGKGIGTEMRAAVLHLAFDHLGALGARSSAFRDNHASIAVSRKLGYVDDGTQAASRRGLPGVLVRSFLTPQRFREHGPPWTTEVSGLGERCRAQLGAIRTAD
ncbi:MAG TPA: GNAT family N-acetyltransferase [Pseudonocardiaceae bacterium]